MGLTNLSVKTVLAGNGANKVFAIPFDIIISDTAEVAVYIRDESVSPATETLQTISTHYTLTGGVGSGFNTDVTFVTAPLATDKVILIRILPRTQTLDLSTSTDSQPESTEKELDRIVAQGQEIGERVDRSIRLTKGAGVTNAEIEPVPNAVVGFDGSGNVLVASVLTFESEGLASQAEAEAGTNNTKAMTPLRTKQKIDYEVSNNALVSPSATQTLTNKTITSPSGLVKADVGLGNVDNTSDLTKDAATATLTNKTITSPSGIVKADVGLGNVDNTSDATKNAAAVTLTNKTLTSPVLNTQATGTAIKDEDTMVSDSATHLATQQSIKAYVDTSSASPAKDVVSKTANFTLTNTNQVVFGDTSGGAFTLTLFTAAGNTGKIVTIKKTEGSVNGLTIDGNGAETIDGSTTKILYTVGETYNIISDGTNWKVLDHLTHTGRQAFTMVLRGVTADPTKPTTTINDQGYWWREGKNMFLQYSYYHSSATGGVNGTGTLLFDVPLFNISTTVVDIITTTLSLTNVGSATYYNGNRNEGNIFVYNTAQNALSISSSNAGNANTTLGANIFTAAPVGLSFSAVVPIDEWED